MKLIKPKDKYLKVNGLRLHYLDWGSRQSQPVLLLHGFMGHAHVWDDFASELSSRYRLIALDQRGHGESQWSKDASYTIDDHFSDIARFVESLDIRDLILVGHSMGGRNALFYTACTPQRVKRLILVDARPDGNHASSRALRRLITTFPLRVKSLDEVVQTIRGLYPYVSVDICHHMAKYGYKQVPNREFVPKYDTRMALLTEQFNYATESLWALMRGVPCFTLILRGEKSEFLSREDAEKMCEIIPRAVFREIPNATHMPAQENPGAFKRVILDFLHGQDACVFGGSQ